jgi:hypothetical protein
MRPILVHPSQARALADGLPEDRTEKSVLLVSPARIVDTLCFKGEGRRIFEK